MHDVKSRSPRKALCPCRLTDILTTLAYDPAAGAAEKKKKREKEEKKRNSLTPQLASYVIEIAFEANPFFLQKKKNSIGKRDIRKCRSRIVYVFGINSTRSTPYACSVYMTFITFQGTAGYVNVLFTSRRRR